MPVLRHIYDSATGTYHDVEVTQEVYDFYRRNAWAIRRSDTRFYAHEIQFSSLIGGEHDAFERFSEFQTDSYCPLSILCDESDKARLVEAFRCLPLSDQHLLYHLVVMGCSERHYGKIVGLHFMTVHNKKTRLLHKLLMDLK